MSEKPRGENKHAMNRWVAAFMPLVMIGLAGYATWVLVVLIGIEYLIRSGHRIPAGAVLITLYFIVLFPFAFAYFRVLWTIYTDPSLVPKGLDASESIINEKIGSVNDSDPEMGLGSVRREVGTFGNPGAPRPGTAVTGKSLDPKDSLNTNHRDGSSATSTTETSFPPPQDLDLAFPSSPHPSRKVSDTPTSNTLLPPMVHQDRPATGSTLQGHSYDAYDSEPPAERPEPENFHEWYNRDVFVCENNGRPIWCYYCNSYKPDRSHHCSELQRCVYKMDHFCPWVGGIVAETSYKFFYQVVVYGAFYCLYLVISLAYFIHEHNRDAEDVNPNWLAALALSCLFGLFSAGMAGSTTQLIYRNLSTVDSLSATLKVYQLAIHDPNPPVQPLPGHAPLVRRVWLPENPAPNQQQRCFAIVSTAPGENPWRLENTMDNFKEVLGYSLWEWWLPIKRSPLVKKDSSEGWYRWNEKLLERLRKDAGIEARGRVTT